MKTEIKIMTAEHKSEVAQMMRVFYASDAVSTDGSPEIFENDINECISNSPFLTGYILEADSKTAGYAMCAHSFSTEFGKPCVWIEDIYIKPDFRGLGIGKMFFEFVEKEYPKALLRLEVEKENGRALALYEKCGFTFLPYSEMMKRADA